MLCSAAGEETLSMAMTRREAREAVFGLLFETDYHLQDTPEVIFDTACAVRDIDEDKYIRAAYFGVIARLDLIDRLLGEHSRGWKTYRMSGVARSAMRIAIWEMLYMDSIPHSVSINEAIEIVKKYDDQRARTFVNGILNAIKEYIEKNPGVADAEVNTNAEKSVADQNAGAGQSTEQDSVESSADNNEVAAVPSTERKNDDDDLPSDIGVGQPE